MPVVFSRDLPWFPHAGRVKEYSTVSAVPRRRGVAIDTRRSGRPSVCRCRWRLEARAARADTRVVGARRRRRSRRWCYAGRVPPGLVAGGSQRAVTIAPHASGTRPRGAPAMSAATPEVRGVPADAASPAVTLPRIKPDLGLNDATLFAVYCFIKNFIG